MNKINPNEELQYLTRTFTSFRLAWKAFQDGTVSLPHRLALFALMPISGLLMVFFHLLDRAPITVLQVFCSLHGSVVAAFISILLAALLEFFVGGIATGLDLLLKQHELLEYVEELARSGVKLKEHKCEAYIGSDAAQNLTPLLPKTGLERLNKYRPELPRCFQMLPPDGVELAEWKGFAIPYGYSSENILSCKSAIFIRDDPIEIRPLGRWKVLHEIGHTTRDCWRRRVENARGLAKVGGIIVWAMANQLSIGTCLPFIAVAFFTFLRRASPRQKELDELDADRIAMTYTPASDRERVVNLLNTILPNRLSSQERVLSMERDIDLLKRRVGWALLDEVRGDFDVLKWLYRVSLGISLYFVAGLALDPVWWLVIPVVLGILLWPYSIFAQMKGSRQLDSKLPTPTSSEATNPA
jgi:hypothetical protein